MNPSRKIRCIINPISGNFHKSKTYNYLQEWSDNKPYFLDIQYTEYEGHATKLAAEALQQNYYAVLAAGGFGTIHEVCTALKDTDTILAVFPQGSGNGFSWHLGIKKNLKIALSYIENGHYQIIDMGVMNNDKYFINLAGLGFDGKVAYNIKGLANKGFLPYFANTTKELFKFRSQYYQILMDGTDMSGDYSMVAIANGSIYGYGFNIAPGASLTDREFDVLLVKRANFLSYIRMIPSMLAGKMIKSPYVQYLKCKQISINSSQPIYYHVDGEGFLENNTMEFKIIPSCLRIFVPEHVIL
ncbi:MAG: diacylglycerol kinase family lipid kinase [Saprospiraceae bacterium]|nr:diacylglycerol kinase family lipid kinase [Saprospiraceae bacterium]